MSYITSITKEILQVTYEDISEDEIFNRVSEIIAKEIIGSRMDRQYSIDAQEYLSGEDKERLSGDIAKINLINSL